MKIKEWLANPTDFNAGVALYEQYGDLVGFKRTLSRSGESESLKAQLIYELSKHQEADQASEQVISPEPPLEDQSGEDSGEKKYTFQGFRSFLSRFGL